MPQKFIFEYHTSLSRTKHFTKLTRSLYSGSTMPLSPARLAGGGGGARDRDQAPPHPHIQVKKYPHIEEEKKELSC